MSSRADALACHTAAVGAVAPARLVGRRLRRTVAGLELVDADGACRARHGGPVLVVGGGKAGVAMATAALAAVGPAAHGGMVVVPHGEPAVTLPGIALAHAAHPVPDDAGLRATARLLALVEAGDAGTLVLFLLSGGASSLLVAPAPGVTLRDKQAVTGRLIASGADIGALNTVRKHCSRLKGGGLARAAARAAGLWALVLSDVVGDDPAVIGSGPTVADPTTFADAEAILARYLAPDAVPVAVRDLLARGRAGAVAETVKPGDAVLAHTRTVIVGRNADAVDAAAACARGLGYETTVLADPLLGDAATAGQRIVADLDRLPRNRAVALVAGGETTVRAVPGGIGGRSQHLALAAACALAGGPGVVLAAGTDGIDGPTDAAGACVDGDTVARARDRGRDPAQALAATDSYRLLADTGDLIVTGPTGTNVADLVVALRPAC